jgi:hypothetical protein
MFSISSAEMMDFGAGAARAVGFIAASTASETAAPAEEMAYRYQYFGDAQAYYDPARELYFYMFNGEWTKSPGLPRELRSRLGDFVIIEMNDSDPYKYHMEVMGRAVPAGAQAETGKPVVSGGPEPFLSYRYYYYPRDQVYYDPTTRTYFYFLDDGWQKSANLPARFSQPLGDFVTIETDTAAPYEYHAQVLQMYFKQAKQLQLPERPPWEAAPGGPVYRYLYYPAAFVYFDEGRRVYYYFTEDQWVQTSTLPAYISQNLGNPVELRMSSSQPYQFHSQVIERYPHPGATLNKSKAIFRIWSGGE